MPEGFQAASSEGTGADGMCRDSWRYLSPRRHQPTAPGPAGFARKQIRWQPDRSAPHRDAMKAISACVSAACASARATPNCARSSHIPYRLPASTGPAGTATGRSQLPPTPRQSAMSQLIGLAQTERARCLAVLLIWKAITPTAGRKSINVQAREPKMAHQKTRQLFLAP
jgi:hypothetical protein